MGPADDQPIAAQLTAMDIVTFQHILVARDRIAGKIATTPVAASVTLSERLDVPV